MNARTDRDWTELKEGLAAIVGERFLADDPAVLDSYSWHMNAESVAGSRFLPRPIAVVLPGSTGEVASVVKLCNRLGAQYKATATGQGPWNSPVATNNTVQIDLRRMDRIVGIDEKNMFAVVEPYVTNNQLQVESMRRGLNCHIIGAGGQSSQLAAATSFNGHGPDGIACGFAGRNLLGFEWVTPEGEIVQVGSFDASGSMFLGDGPGPSLRGIIRGFAGAMGGLGVFTKAAVKLYPWQGPARFEVEGLSPSYYTRIPDEHTVGILCAPDWRRMADLGYALGEAEIADYVVRNAPALTIPAMYANNNEAAAGYSVPLLRAFNHNLYTVFTARHDAELRYKQKAISEMCAEVGAGFLGRSRGLHGFLAKVRWLKIYARRIGLRNLLRSIPGMARFVLKEVRLHGIGKLRYGNPIDNTLYGKLLRADSNVRAGVSLGGTFCTSLGAIAPWDVSVRSAQLGSQIQQKFVARGEIVDNDGDGGHGGLYEGGAFSHIETVALYDPRDRRQAEAMNRYVAQTNQAAIDHHLGVAINSFGPTMAWSFSPVAMDYDRIIQRIKAAFDPNDAADGSWYTDPQWRPSAAEQAVLEAAKRERLDVGGLETSDTLQPPPVPHEWLRQRGYVEAGDGPTDSARPRPAAPKSKRRVS